MTLLLPYTARLTLSGLETVPLLERLVTCRVDNMEQGDTRPGALLTPQGKVIADFIMTRTNTGCTLDTSLLIADTLEKRLNLFRLRADVQIEPTKLDLQDIDHAGRIASGQPAFGYDFTDAKVFPTDINLDMRGGIDYRKGCFVGQEVVSRMKRRGKIRKRTIILKGENLQTGDTIEAGLARLGNITSASKTHALALVRTDHLAKARSAGHALTVNTIEVSPIIPDWLTLEMEGFANT